jgi:hypothetical protein
MKRFFLLLNLLFLPLATAQAQSAGPFDLPNDDLANIQLEIERIQPQYLEIAGRYLQVLPTTPDNLQQKPTDGPLSLAEVGANLAPAKSPLMFAVQEYDGPYGVGYVLLAYVEIEGQVYEKSIHFGLDPAFASHDWSPLTRT